jgi:hypothetical protein
MDVGNRVLVSGLDRSICAAVLAERGERAPHHPVARQWRNQFSVCFFPIHHQKSCLFRYEKEYEEFRPADCANLDQRVQELMRIRDSVRAELLRLEAERSRLGKKITELNDHLTKEIPKKRTLLSYFMLLWLIHIVLIITD